MVAPSKSNVYFAIASAISLILINSSAEWEREDSPGPNLKEGNDIKAWSLSVGLPNGYTFFNKGMLRVDTGRLQTETMSLALALQVLADEMIDFLVVVKLVGANIHKHGAFVGYHIVLCPCVHHGQSHLCRT